MPKKGFSNKPDTDPNLSNLAAQSSGDDHSGEKRGAEGEGAPSGKSGSGSDKNKSSEKNGESGTNGEAEVKSKTEESQDQTTFSSNVSSSMGSTSDGSDNDALIGKVLLGKYQIIELLGAGGMSRVFKAQQMLTKKVVALKLLHKHLSSNPVMMRRFQAEAQASHHLAHMHIITVYDFGVTEDNQPFIVMDYLEGRALSEIVRTWGQLSIERCLKITDQILDALEHAHESGVLHRDLKPSNIVLIPVGENTDYVKLVDFGIAKILPKAGLEAQELTQSGDVFGSPLYMSPEQCLGNMTDARSDIYAVGCLLYECLTGKPPLIGNNTLETMHKQVSEMPAGLSNVKADVRLVKQLEDIVFKAMAKEPENRFQSALEMRKAIEQTQQEWREGLALLAYMRRSGATYQRFFQNRLGKRWRSKVAVAALMIAVTLHCVIVMTILYYPGSAPEITERTIPWTAVNQPLYQLIAAEKMRKLKPVTDASDTEQLVEITSEIAAVSQSESAQYRNFQYRGVDKLYNGDFDAAYHDLTQAIKMANSVGMSDSMDTGYMHMAVATCLFEMSKLGNKKDSGLLSALNEIRNAVFVFMSASQSRPLTIARCIEGDICDRLGKRLEAIFAFKHVTRDAFYFIAGRAERQRIRDRLRPDAPNNFAWGEISQSAMGYQLATLGNFFLENDEGLNELQWAVEESSLPNDTAAVAGLPTRDKIRELVFSRGKLVPRCVLNNQVVNTYIVDAEDVYQLLVGMCEQRGAGRGSLSTGVARSNLGMARLKKGLALRDLSIEKMRDCLFDQSGPLLEQAQTRFQQAATELRLARKALELHLGSNHKYVAYTLLNLSDAELNMGHVNEALEARAEAHTILGLAGN